MRKTKFYAAMKMNSLLLLTTIPITFTHIRQSERKQTLSNAYGAISLVHG